ncbi:hypothetical protein SUGI_0243180 [Cryptomeria japonica]|nr:hypothetical protein SUGI_0243180 [Cryptomeria japonica]
MQGHAIYPIPLHFRYVSSKSAFSFSTTFVMSIVHVYQDVGGHGLPFMVTLTRSFQRSFPNQYLGGDFSLIITFLQWSLMLSRTISRMTLMITML